VKQMLVELQHDDYGRWIDQTHEGGTSLAGKQFASIYKGVPRAADGRGPDLTQSSSRTDPVRLTDEPRPARRRTPSSSETAPKQVAPQGAYAVNGAPASPPPPPNGVSSGDGSHLRNPDGNGEELPRIPPRGIPDPDGARSRALAGNPNRRRRQR
jgi:hypothetical protein